MLNTEDSSSKVCMTQCHESILEFTMQKTKTTATKTLHTSHVRTWMWNEIVQRSRIKVTEMNYLYECSVQRMGN